MAQEHLNKFMERFDLQFPYAHAQDRDKVLACVTDFLTAGEGFLDLPANDDNVFNFMVEAMRTRYGVNEGKLFVREWSKAYTPGTPKNISMAMFMCMACLALRGQELAATVRDTAIREWTESMTVWELMCLVPFFFTLKDK